MTSLARPPSSPTSRPSNAARRSAIALAIVGGVALTAIASLSVLIATQTAQRIDVTATRAHQLAPRTAALVAQMRSPVTLVVADLLSGVDPGVRDALGDVIDRLTRARAGTAAPFVARLMDTASPQGLAEFDALMADLAQRERVVVENRVDVLSALADQLAELGPPVAQLAQRMDQSRDAVLAAMNKNAQARWDAYAAALRTASDDASRASASARSKLAAPARPLPIPAIDEAKATLLTASQTLSLALSRLSTDLEGLAGASELPDSLRGAIRPLATDLGPARDRAAQIAADVGAVAPPRVLSIARAIERGRAALLIGAGGGAANAADPGDGMGVDIVAIEPAALLVPRPGVGPRAAVEDVIAGALASLTSPVRPVVVLVHEAPQRLAPAGFAPFSEAVRRLSTRGIETTEWPVAIERDLPATLSRTDPLRPAVFVVVPSLVESRQARTLTIGRYIDALRTLIAQGRPVLVNVEPSMVVAAGGPDPVLAPLAAMGLSVDSGRVLLEEAKVGTRRVVSPNADAVTPLVEGATLMVPAAPSPTTGAVIAGTLQGLATRLVTPAQITLEEPPSPGITPKALASGLRITPILQVPATPQRWAESEWSEYRDAVVQLRGDFTRINQGPRRDTSGDRQATGPAYTLAVAIERPDPQASPSQPGPNQRLVVVGAAGWFTDAVAQQQVEVDGRVVPLLQGNLQLLESSVLWLAGQESALARGAVSVATPTIPALSDGQVLTIRWVLALGLPALVLIGGVVYRQTRRV
jgi:hypothetical protein